MNERHVWTVEVTTDDEANRAIVDITAEGWILKRIEQPAVTTANPYLLTFDRETGLSLDDDRCETCDGTGAAEDDDPGGGSFDCADCDGTGSADCDLRPPVWVEGDR